MNLTFGETGRPQTPHVWGQARETDREVTEEEVHVGVENRVGRVLTPRLQRGMRGLFSPRDARRAEDIPATRGCQGVYS